MSRIQTTIRNVQRPGGIASVGASVGGRIAGRLDPLIRGDQGIERYAGDTSKIYEAFLRNLLASTNSPSLKPLWVCFLDDIPSSLGATADALDENSTSGKHGFAKGANPAINSADNWGSIDLRGGKAALICQECQVPGDKFNVGHQRLDNMGGFLSPATGSNRDDFKPVKIAYLETNYSFTDFVLRPWAISTSYTSLKLAPRTTITMIKYAKAGPGNPLVPVKFIKFFGCCPIDIDTEPYTYKDQSLTIRQVEWHYDTYTMEFGGMINGSSPLPREKETLVGQLLDDFLGEQKPGTDLKTRIGSFASDAVDEARGFVANKAGQIITSNFADFGRRLEEMTGARSTLPPATRGRIDANDTPTSTQQKDDVRVPENDTPNIFLENARQDKVKGFNQVVEEQANKAKNREDDVNVTAFDLIAIDENDTPDAPSITLTNVEADPNDVPPPSRILQDSVRMLPNNTPNIFKGFNRVVEEQVNKAQEIDFHRVEIPERGTPDAQNLKTENVVINPNDVPPPSRILQDSVRITPNDTPENLANR